MESIKVKLQEDKKEGRAYVGDILNHRTEKTWGCVKSPDLLNF